MIEWKQRKDCFDGFENGKQHACIYENNSGFYLAIATSDGYYFIFNVLPSLQLAKNVCELALSENKTWEWWLENQEKWWYENVSQV